MTRPPTNLSHLRRTINVACNQRGRHPSSTGNGTSSIVMTVLFVWICFLGLLFLLVKERRLSGWVTVTVQSPAGYHATQVAVSAPAQIADAEQRVHHIRSLVAAARHG